MRVRTLVGVMAVSFVSVVVTHQAEHLVQPVVPSEAEIIAQLPKNIQALLPAGLCDNIQAAFMVEVQRFPMTPTANRPDVLERIEYYREWLRRKGCG